MRLEKGQKRKERLSELRKVVIVQNYRKFNNEYKYKQERIFSANSVRLVLLIKVPVYKLKCSIKRRSQLQINFFIVVPCTQKRFLNFFSGIFNMTTETTFVLPEETVTSYDFDEKESNNNGLDYHRLLQSYKR